ncbi:hypothetical protein C8R46DRAFT_343171 [Mycena filopes]|nr:hypothetical protein C8R46DRAFT_343171 [Mycena filopes]
MLQWKEFSAWITIEGQEVPEYDVQISEDEKTVTCWIPSEVGKKFSVWFKTTSFSQEIGAALTMDGSSCGGRFMNQQNWRKTIEHNGITDDGTTLRPFIFSPLALTDDDSFLGSSSHPELGVIQLSVVPIAFEQLHDQAPGKIFSLAELKLHERSKKAVTQQISLARPEPLATRVALTKARRTGPDIVKFFFKYRPLDVLRANGIAPQLKRKTPTPPTPRAATPEDEEVLADVREAQMLRERLKALEAKLQKRDKKPRVKDEFGNVVDLTRDGDGDGGSRRNKRVKVEESRLRPFMQGEVIDLT